MKRLSKFFLTLLAVMISMSFTQMASATLITNGGFETGDFTGWSQSGDTYDTGVDSSIAHSGTYGAYLGPVESNGFLSQTIATTIGADYLIKFWLCNDPLTPNGTPNDFLVSFGGSSLFSLTDAPAQSYTEYKYAVTATAVTSTLEFGFQHTPRYWFLDDVDVSAVPEPATMLLFGFGLLGIAGVSRRKK